MALSILKILMTLFCCRPCFSEAPSVPAPFVTNSTFTFYEKIFTLPVLYQLLLS
jgi:hypothetical protein